MLRIDASCAITLGRDRRKEYVQVEEMPTADRFHLGETRISYSSACVLLVVCYCDIERSCGAIFAH